MGSVNNGGEKQAVHSSNDNATRRVPENEQKGFWSVAFVCAGFCICMSVLPQLSVLLLPHIPQFCFQ